jgi:hypothetical protein
MRANLRRFQWGFVGCLVAWIQSSAQADGIPPSPLSTTFVQYQINNASPTVVPIGGGKTATFSFTDPLLSVSGSGSINRDPFIDYGIQLTNTTDATMTFELVIGIPVSPVSEGYALATDLSLNLIDHGDHLIRLSPLSDGLQQSLGIQRSLLSTDGGATFNPLYEFGPLGGTLDQAGFYQYHFRQPGSSSQSTLIFNYLEVILGFNLSAGDSVIISGDAILTCPEPSTLAMGLSCICLLTIRFWWLRQQSPVAAMNIHQA